MMHCDYQLAYCPITYILALHTLTEPSKMTD
jgi:hypothetical protein